MSYTLTNLKLAQKALADNNVARANYHIELLINRMEKILYMRKNWKPRCELTENDNDNGKTEVRTEEPSGKLGHTGDTGILKIQ